MKQGEVSLVWLKKGSTSMSMSWNPSNHDAYDALKGKDVYTADNEKIGTVDEVLHPANDTNAPDQHYLLVKPGMLERIAGQDEFYVPATSIQMEGEDRVVLETTKESFGSRDWPEPGDGDAFRRH